MSKKLQAESLQAEASVKDKILNGINAYTPLLRENFKSTFVTLQGGKDLSTNDFTNAYKTKLDSIQSGAQVNIIENISVNGVNASIDNKTANITLSADNSFVINNHTVKSASIEGADVTFTSDTAKISITGGEGSANFTVNGAEVTAMSVVGAASVSTQSNTAIVSITGGTGSKMTLNGAEIDSASIIGASITTADGSAGITIPTAVQEVTVVGGALQASIEGSKLFLLGSNATVQKASANFSLSADNVTVPSWTPATISASRLGDGLIKCYNSRFASAEQINATEFRIAPKHAGSGAVGFWLDETQDYYGAAKNVQIYSPEIAPHILMHFDDASDIWKNDGNLTATINYGTESIVEGGKFGSYLKVSSGATRIGVVLGGDDFSIEYFTKYFASTTKANDLKVANGYFGVANLGENFSGFSAPNATRTANLEVYDVGYGLLDWTHIAYVYDHTAGELNLFVGGKLKKTWEVTYDEMTTELNCWPGLDELRIVKGTAIYVEDFTPPTEPF